MMMSKPAPTASKVEETAGKPAAATTTTTKKSPQDAVADLERRLAELSTHIPETAKQQNPPPSIATAFNPTVQEAAPPPASTTDAATTAPVKGGKNALLARIMAAQERAKQAQNAPAIASSPSEEEETPPPFTDDLLMMDNVQPPPPAFDPMLLPPPTDSQLPPPAFDDSLLPPPTSSTTKMVFDPLAPSVNTMMAPPEPSAPSFEDLDFLGGQTIMQPPPQEPDAEIIMGFEGLSPEEKRELLEEQKRIMASIEANKANTVVSAAAARADAFEQRSFSANVQAASRSVGGGRSGGTVTIGNESVPLHGAEATQRAMQDGTALTVQCLACDNWMQVTKEAAMMFCPVCSTVSPVVIPENGPGAGAAASSPSSNQLSEDMKLAEALQQEEYKMAERQEERRKNRGASAGAAAAQPADASSQGWMEWLGLSSTSPTATSSSSPERPASFAQPPAQRGYQAVTLPPGSSASASTTTRGSGSPSRMMAAQTETVRFEEDDDLLLSRGRVAAQKPLFSCVADSITSAATSLYTTTLPEDDEGNVHGVDSSSLLAVTNYRREEEKK